MRRWRRRMLASLMCISRVRIIGGTSVIAWGPATLDVNGLKTLHGQCDP